MKKIVFSVILAVAALSSGSAFSQAPDQADEIIRGRYQAILADCGACHTAPGAKPLSGGRPLETPFGQLIPPNITPDKATGIGNWTEQDFRRAMKIGIGHDGKRLYPAMPYPAYTKMSDQDIGNLWSYLRTVEPVFNPVESNQLPFPFNIRLSMLGWNTINFEEGTFKPDPSKSSEWNRGAYIVQGPGHCGTCHSPKTFLGADKTDEALQGASLQGWYAPNITGNPHIGIGSWNEDEIVQYLKTGANAHTIASGPMAEAIQASTSLMTDEDLKAIATYLKSTEGGSAEKPQPLAASDPHMTAGAAIYHDTCSACHGGEGKGARQLFPALAGSPLVQQPSAETLVRLVLNGSQAVATPEARTTPSMPSLGWRLSDQQVADVLTYIRNSWGNAAPAVQPSDIAGQR
ncbi:Cytochrome c, mono-and diheme variants [Xaviernesmea oryzae]|uniref:Cytochrome c, mono-and diheme variants n=1 Tax=Xaviernesmea oryzae TaxID=464029 RepID=A0A1X7DRW3_9HYPH|nr:c-type cytochrome [Xaviernesmea oryzae]SMF20033.1 Cytochrome c, mono-and diheme variants [Xaviernesmea oryzae]